MAGASWDTSELRQLSADLGQVSDEAAGKVKATTVKAALNIKRQMQAEATDTIYFTGVARTITYSTAADSDGFGADIGPEIGKKPQGSLAWIAYDGTAVTPPTFPDPAGVLDAEAGRWQEFIAAAVMEGL